MHELYTLYSHMDDEIAETVGLATATKHVSKEKAIGRPVTLGYKP
jgi:hypothetical protein